MSFVDSFESILAKRRGVYDELAKGPEQAPCDQLSEQPEETSLLESDLQLAEERLQGYREDSSSSPAAFVVIDLLARKS